MRRFFTVSLAALSVLFAVPAYAQEASAPTVTDQEVAPAASTAIETQAPVTVAPADAPHTLTVLEAIQQAHAILKAELAKRQAAGKKTVKAQPSWADVTLAVWEKDANRIVQVDIQKSGRSIKVKTPGDWPISVSYDNRVYSTYALPASRNATVVGVVYPVAKKLSAKSYQITDTIYVPFQDEFYRPEVLAAGSDYLSFLIQQAFDELRAKGIRSKAFPDKLVVDVIDPYLIKSIVVIEHADNTSLVRKDDPERVLGTFLGKLAVNGEESFDTALSSAGAAGLVQFIPSTYKLYVKNRPQYELIPDFATGMADHKNAIKAEVAYLDDSLAELPGTVRETYASDKMQAAGYLAAAYNGGTVRVTRAIGAFGDDWAVSHKKELAQLNSLAAQLRKKTTAAAKKQRADAVARIAVLNKASLKEETVYYVAKLRATYGMFAAGMFSTPAAPSGALPAVAQTAVQTIVTPASDTAAGGPEAICFADGGCVPTP